LSCACADALTQDCRPHAGRMLAPFLSCTSMVALMSGVRLMACAPPVPHGRGRSGRWYVRGATGVPRPRANRAAADRSPPHQPAHGPGASRGQTLEELASRAGK